MTHFILIMGLSLGIVLISMGLTPDRVVIKAEGSDVADKRVSCPVLPVDAYVKYDIDTYDGPPGSEKQVIAEVTSLEPITEEAVVAPSELERVRAALVHFNSPYADKADYIFEKAVEYGLDPILMVSIMGAESSMGKNCYYYNCFGWHINDSGTTWHKGQFTSFEEAIDRIFSEYSKVYGSCGSNIRCVSGIDRGSGYNVRESWVNSVGWFHSSISNM